MYEALSERALHQLLSSKLALVSEENKNISMSAWFKKMGGKDDTPCPTVRPSFAAVAAAAPPLIIARISFFTKKKKEEGHKAGARSGVRRTCHFTCLVVGL